MLPADFYTGIVAELYGPLKSVAQAPEPYAVFVREAGSPALELGCGDGDPLLDLRWRGLDVEGVDSSADMLQRCRRRARKQGVDVVVHHQRMEALDLVNDLFSCRAEWLKGDYFNAAGVLLHGHAANLQAAVDLICDRIRQADQVLSALGDRLRHRYRDPDLRACLDTLDDFCAGNLRWSLETTRYNGTGIAWNGRRTGRVTFHHDQTAITEVPEAATG
ncbi:class I SAM-dependent methyltransferase [Nonomuraea jabiensis]|uniref:SAM-dependent methyltransferase n=1 Tax=Nonomuraea jabiensis TaxID=882448 RepID=A0A7W9GB44_9ACTN|nr:methyltransferase domain-containing protein [Nonomuraea jabiensis]MBB5780519.1 SAM-dependent methyltransferase [Nonomuraea jabiensis]